MIWGMGGNCTGSQDVALQIGRLVRFVNAVHEGRGFLWNGAHPAAPVREVLEIGTLNCRFNNYARALG
jgi:hypothetical protein